MMQGRLKKVLCKASSGKNQYSFHRGGCICSFLELVFYTSYHTGRWLIKPCCVRASQRNAHQWRIPFACISGKMGKGRTETILHQVPTIDLSRNFTIRSQFISTYTHTINIMNQSADWLTYYYCNLLRRDHFILLRSFLYQWGGVVWYWGEGEAYNIILIND